MFGEAQLRVSDLRSIRWLGSQAELEVTVDGAKYAVSGNQWMDTGVELSLEDELAVSASGQIDLFTNGGGQYITGPAGTAQWGAIQPVTRQAPCSAGSARAGRLFLLARATRALASEKASST